MSCLPIQGVYPPVQVRRQELKSLNPNPNLRVYRFDRLIRAQA